MLIFVIEFLDYRYKYHHKRFLWSILSSWKTEFSYLTSFNGGVILKGLLAMFELESFEK